MYSTLISRLENSKPHTNGRLVVGGDVFKVVAHCKALWHSLSLSTKCSAVLRPSFQQEMAGVKTELKCWQEACWQFAKLSHSHLPSTSQGICTSNQIVFICEHWLLLGGQKTHLATWSGNDGDVMRPGRSWWSGHDDMQTKSVSAPRQNWCVLKLF